VLSSTAAELEALALALRERSRAGADLAALLPRASGEAGISLRATCPCCDGKLYVQDYHSWLTCGGCLRLFVPKAELPALVDDPALALRPPLDLPRVFSPSEVRADRRAHRALGLFAFASSALCLLLGADLWRSPPAWRLGRVQPVHEDRWKNPPQPSAEGRVLAGRGSARGACREVGSRRKVSRRGGRPLRARRLAPCERLIPAGCQRHASRLRLQCAELGHSGATE
jgi:hypothetical protein